MIDPKTSPCFGRGRTLPKIARWHGMDGAEQRAVIGGIAATHGGRRLADDSDGSRVAHRRAVGGVKP
jgi:predicted Fe-S protein YdhL (DUF1289 family)